jgi:hypothetical protein
LLQAAAALRRWLRSHPFVLVLLPAIALRVTMMILYRPTALNVADAVRYAHAAQSNIWEGPFQPAGYPLFLRAVGAITRRIEVFVALQHVLGILSAWLCYDAARRLGVRRWLALGAAGLVALSGDQLFLEHAILTESLVTFFLAASLWFAVRWPGGGRSLVGVALSALCVSLALCTRTSILAVAPFAGVALVLLAPGWRARAQRACVFGLVLLVVIGSYFALHDRATDSFGFGVATGWGLYIRAATFADCTRFDPPAGTEFLCESVPVDQRPGSDWYAWVDGPARARFGAPPTGDATVGRFARAAIRAQPLAYARLVATDGLRYFEPDFGTPRPWSGVDESLTDIDRRVPTEAEVSNHHGLEVFFDPFTYHYSPKAKILANYQDLMRVHPSVFFQLTIVSLAGIWGRGRGRTIGPLLGVISIAVPVVSCAAAIYQQRYSIPVNGPLGVAAAVSVEALLLRSKMAPSSPPATGAQEPRPLDVETSAPDGRAADGSPVASSTPDDSVRRDAGQLMLRSRTSGLRSVVVASGSRWARRGVGAAGLRLAIASPQGEYRRMQ